jgi:chromosome segregation ATPase
MRATQRTPGVVTSDIEELQQKISETQKELVAVKAELDATRQQAKTLEGQTQESGRTNRKLRNEVQTLTDMSQRKERQAENSKATAFFFEGQLRKYVEEIDNAKNGLEHLKALEDDMLKAKKQATESQQKTDAEYRTIREEITKLQQQHLQDIQSLKETIQAIESSLSKATSDTLDKHHESEARLNKLLASRQNELKNIEEEYATLQGKQEQVVNMVEDEVKALLDRLKQSEATTEGYEATMTTVKTEMDRIMLRLRTLKDVQNVQ